MKSDIYSFGIIMFELITAIHPQQNLMEYINLVSIDALTSSTLSFNNFHCLNLKPWIIVFPLNFYPKGCYEPRWRR